MRKVRVIPAAIAAVAVAAGAGAMLSGAQPEPAARVDTKILGDALHWRLVGPFRAGRVNAVYCDYYSATVDAQGFFKSGFTNDGLHPNAQGYELMAPVAAAALAKVVP